MVTEIILRERQRERERERERESKESERERERERERELDNNFVLLFKLESTTEKMIYIKVEELNSLFVSYLNKNNFQKAHDDSMFHKSAP